MTPDPDTRSPTDPYAVYLYGFCHADCAPIAVPAVDGGTVFLQPQNNLTAVVSRVRACLFTGAEAERRLQDSTWVTIHGCRHATVVEQLVQRGGVFPVPFGTLFSSPENLKKTMRQKQRYIERTLAAVAGRNEWALKGILDRDLAARTLLAMKTAESGEPPPSPGLQHLYEQRLRRAAETELSGWLQQKCLALAQKLTDLAKGFRERNLLPREKDQGEMIFNWAYLVPETNTEVFCTAVEEAAAALRGCGLTLEFSGAWPPYSFCDIDR